MQFLFLEIAEGWLAISVIFFKLNCTTLDLTVFPAELNEVSCCLRKSHDEELRVIAARRPPERMPSNSQQGNGFCQLPCDLSSQIADENTLIITLQRACLIRDMWATEIETQSMCL